MPSIGKFAVILAVFAGVAWPAAAEQRLTPGQKVSVFVDIGKKQVPLPAGEWIVAAEGANATDHPEIDGYGAIRNVVLFRIADGTVDAVAEINANTVPVVDGWGTAKDCTRKDLYVAVTRYRSGWDATCFFVKRTRNQAAESGPSAWLDALRFAKDQRLALPAFWITVGMRVTDRQDIIDARFHLNPATRGFAAELAEGAGEGSWSVAEVNVSPRKLRLFSQITDWAAGYDAFIYAGLHNQFGKEEAALVPGLPYGAVGVSDQPLVDAKLLMLERLRDTGFITQAQYVNQEARALKDPLVVPAESAVPLSLQKNISFRVFGSAVDWILAFVVTVNPRVSSYITATIVSTHSVIFVANENYWESYFAAQTKRDMKRVVDFAYAGTEPAT